MNKHCSYGFFTKIHLATFFFFQASSNRGLSTFSSLLFNILNPINHSCLVWQVLHYLHYLVPFFSISFFFLLSRYAPQDAIKQKKKEDDADTHLAKKIMRNKQYTVFGQVDDEYDFEDAPSRKSQKKGVGDERNYVVKRIVTQQERCQFCFENPTRPKHLIISIANFTYLMLPPWQPVVPGHCCILPMQVRVSVSLSFFLFFFFIGFTYGKL